MFPILIHAQVFSREISFACRLKYPYNCFTSHFCFLVIVVLLILVLVFFLVVVISLSFPFLCCLRVVLLMYWRYLQCWQILFLFLSLTHMVCLRHPCDVMPYASLLIFFFSGPFVEVLLWSTSGFDYLTRRIASVLFLTGIKKIQLLLLLLLLLVFFFTSANSDGLPLEFEWQQVSSSLQDS